MQHLRVNPEVSASRGSAPLPDFVGHPARTIDLDLRSVGSAHLPSTREGSLSRSLTTPASSFALRRTRALSAHAAVAHSAPSLEILAGGVNGTLLDRDPAELGCSRRGFVKRDAVVPITECCQKPVTYR